jgi:hypothetical protein
VAVTRTLEENTELAARTVRIRKRCGDLEAAPGAAGQRRELAVQMKRDAYAVHKALTAKSSPAGS